ncbi:transposase family protein [Colwellia sp. 6M3]|uniref:DDE-type integrase/transposase/recombinase n=1 Tax=Colwellia sp. 6M3 TaxID=2759849 RepID=UPI0015F76C71|nr:DDE-type integrase/transposase/recombinase [Colwellia sp. 6M3]MBA6417547.1 transposase family protein [Colwellia sp. 6M3]|tara:strand:+ start:2371 stop:4437 length:2067 start_codon:yes stop_codon:yes gene_type:complete
MQALATTYASFTPGTRFNLKGENSDEYVHYLIVLSDSKTVVAERENGEREPFHVCVLQGLIGEKLEFVRNEPVVPVIPLMTDIQRAQVERKMIYINCAIEANPSAPTAKKSGLLARAKAMGITGDKYPAGLSTINGWVKKYNDNLKSQMALLSQGGRGRNSKFCSNIVELADTVIVDCILCSEPYTCIEAYEILKVEALKVGYEEKDLPCASTFANWVSDLKYYDVVEAQCGRTVRDFESRQMMKIFECSSILARVEFDAVHIQIGLLDDETHEYLGSVIVMMAIDVFSRCILGYSLHVGQGGETVELTVECMQHAVMPKKRKNWEKICGKMSMAVCDAGAAFVSDHFLSYLAHFKINRLTTAVKKPFRKPFIESFFRTLRIQHLSKLPGYLGSARFKGVFTEKSNLKKEATLTVSEFRESLEEYICDHYHMNSHNGLRNNRTPFNVWNKSVSDAPGLVSFPEDTDLFTSWGGRVKHPKLHQNRGFTVNTHRYNAPILQDWYSELKGNPMFKDKGLEIQVSYSNLNIGHIIAFHPISYEWIFVPNTNQRIYDGMSELEYKSMLDNEIGPSHKKKRNVYDAHNNTAIQNAIGRKNSVKSEEAKLKAKKKSLATKEKAEKLKKQGKEDLTKPVELGKGNLAGKLASLANQNKPKEKEVHDEPSPSVEVDTQVEVTEHKTRKKGSRIRAKF